MWLQQFSMSSLLTKAGVLPDDNLTVLSIHKAIKDTLNRNPSIHCIQERHTGDIYLSEIRICFSKQLELVDCDGVVKPLLEGLYEGGNVITNCNVNKTIHYPSVVPPSFLNRHEPTSSSLWKFPFVNVYKLIQLVKWFTL